MIPNNYPRHYTTLQPTIIAQSVSYALTGRLLPTEQVEWIYYPKAVQTVVGWKREEQQP